MKRLWLLALFLFGLLGLGALLVGRVQQQSALYAQASEIFDATEQFFLAGQKSLLFGRDDQTKQDVTAIAVPLFPVNWQQGSGQLTHAYGGSVQVWLELTKGQRRFTLELSDLTLQPCAVLVQLLSQRLHRLGPPQQFALNNTPIRQADLTIPAARELCQSVNSLQIYIRY